MNKTWIAMFVVLLASVFSLAQLEAAAPAAASYRFITVDVPGFTFTQVRGINDFGELVGVYRDQASLTHGFLLSYGNYTFLDFPGASQTYARGINNQGTVVGFFFDNLGNFHGFTYQNGNFRQIDYPGALGTTARSINNLGQISGDYDDPNGINIHGFVLTNGKFRVFDFPGATLTQGYGINDHDQVVGSYSLDGSTLNGYYFRNGKFTSYDVQGFETEILALNNVGQAAGYYAGLDADHSFVISTGGLVTLDPPGSVAALGQGINSLGVVVGSYNDGLRSHGYVAIPIQ